MSDRPATGMSLSDYDRIARLSTTNQIIDTLVKSVFEIDLCNIRKILTLVRNLVLVLVIRDLVEDCKKYLDKFDFRKLLVVRYWYQWLFYRQTTTQLQKVQKHWIMKQSDEEMKLSHSALNTVLSKYHIDLNTPSTYYFSEAGYLLRVVVREQEIIIHAPQHRTIQQFLSRTLEFCKENVSDSSTAIYRVKMQGAGCPTLAPLSIIHAVETENYKRLSVSIAKYFVIDEFVVNNSVPLTINFNGPPGTGKTTFSSYIAPKNLFDIICLFNMVQASNQEFAAVLRNVFAALDKQVDALDLEHNKAPRTLLIIDEFDKWLDSYINWAIDDLNNKAMKKVSTSSSDKPSMVINYEKMSPEDEKFKRKQLREKALDELYNFLENQTCSSKRTYRLVLVFNTNHFERIFHEVDAKYDALKNRFQKYQFGNIGKNEVVEYIKGIHTKIEHAYEVGTITGLLKKQTNQLLKELKVDDFDDLPEELALDYRTLQTVMNMCCYNVKAVVKELSKKV